MFFSQTVRDQLLIVFSTALAFALCTAGMALFTGFIPGRVVHHDIYDAATRIARPDSQPACSDCGIVEQIREIHLAPPAQDAADEGAGRVMPVADWPAVLGTAADAFAGQVVEPVAGNKRYVIAIRMADGRLRVSTVDDTPSYAVGDRVRLTGVRDIVAAGYDI
jgi:hypothetical protein